MTGLQKERPRPHQKKLAFPRSLMSRGKTPTPRTSVLKAFHRTLDENLKFKCIKEGEG